MLFKIKSLNEATRSIPSHSDGSSKDKIESYSNDCLKRQLTGYSSHEKELLFPVFVLALS